MPRDKTGLDGIAWKDLPETETAKRRKSATGADARNRNTYSQVTKTKNKTERVILTDFGALTALQRPGKIKRKFITRVSSFFPLSEKGKMIKEEATDVVKADEKPSKEEITD